MSGPPMGAEEWICLMVKHRVAKAKVVIRTDAGGERGTYDHACEFELHPSAFAAPGETPLPSGPPIGELNGGPPTDDEMLFASSPYPLTKDELNAPEKP